VGLQDSEDPQAPLVALDSWVTKDHQVRKVVLVRLALKASLEPLVNRVELVQWDKLDPLELKAILVHRELEVLLGLMVSKDREDNVVDQETKVLLVRWVILELMEWLVLLDQEEVQA